MRYFNIEVKFLVGCLFFDLIAWLPYTDSDNAKIRIVATWSHSFTCSGNGRNKNPLDVSGFLESHEFFQRCIVYFRIYLGMLPFSLQ